jgi:RNA polymerase sigma-70 factor (ECF subfamily)
MARGLQHADAQDLSQQVLMAVASAIVTWEKRDESTRFRHWMSRVTKNAILNALMRRPKDQAVGGSSIEELLREVVDRDGATTALLENQLRRELYLQAAEMIKADFRPESWQAFELSVTGELTIEQVAQQLGKSVGAIYTARSRIMFRLREIIAELGE